MLEFLIASIVSCSGAKDVIDRVLLNESLSSDIKAELVSELIEHSKCDRNATVD